MFSCSLDRVPRTAWFSRKVDLPMTSSSGGVLSSARQGAVDRFDGDRSADSPAFDDIASVAWVTRSPTQTLHAEYFDTPGRDLAAHNVLLARRAGGTEDGWHLTLPAGEIHTPPDIDNHGDVPATLRDVVLAITRDRPLAPVARTTAHRTVDTLFDANDVALAEFTDEEVAVAIGGDDTGQRWREWKLVLTGAGAAHAHLHKRLSKRLRGAGGVPLTARSQLAHLLHPVPSSARPPVEYGNSVDGAVAEQVERLLVWDRAVRADADDSVHQMRVTCRTIRSLLQASGSAFGVSTDAWICEELQLLATILGTARDAEVLAERYGSALDELPAELVRGPIRQRLIDGARHEYESGLRDSLRMMRSERYFRLLEALEVRTSAEPQKLPQRKPPSEKAAVRAAYKRVCERVKVAARADPRHRDDALHAIRKSAKRLRYVAAATGAETVSAAAADIQTLLGDHHDSVVSRAHLLEHTDAAYAAAEDTFTYGLLHRGEADLARDCENRLHDAMAMLDRAVSTAR
ncbi:CYTH and CHAD domain-containing protein [soil metagenome]